MHEPLLAQAALPAPARVCGITLRPYSLAHELYLIREESPFVLGGEVLPNHLFDAIWICCSTWEALQNASSDWLQIVRLMLLRRCVNKACDTELKLEAQAAAFAEYRRLGVLEFPLSDIARGDAEKGRTPGAPFILRLHEFLMEQCRLSYAEAWDFRCGEAIMRWQCYWEAKEGLEIYNSDLNAKIDSLIAADREGAA